MRKQFLTVFFILTGCIISNAQTLVEGLKAIDFEKYEQARNIFKELVSKEPKKGDYNYYLGQTYVYLMQTDSAIQAYHSGITAEANNPKNYIGLGEILMNENKIAEAKVQFTKALSFSKDREGNSSDALALAMVAEAMVDGETKLLDEALSYVKQALEINKRSYEILTIAGDVYLEMNNGGEAANNYERAIKLDSNNAKAYTKVSNIWLRVRNGEAAYDALVKALAKDSNYALALRNMAELYFQSRKYEKAKEYYARYLSNSEPSISNKIRFAQILFKTKEYDEVLSKIEEIFKADQNNIYLFRLGGYSCYEVAEAKKDTSRYRIGIDYMESFFKKVEPKKILLSDYEYYGKLLSKVNGREEDGILNFNKVLNLDSSKIEMYNEIAKTYNKQRKYGDAATNFEIYINKKNKPNAIDYSLLGRAFYNSKQFGKSDTAYMKLIELRPDYADSYYQRGNCNAFLDVDGQYTVAKEQYEKYLLLTEPTPDKYKKQILDAYDYLAKYYIKKDDNAKAKEYLNKTLALDPENKTAKEYLKQLK